MKEVPPKWGALQDLPKKEKIPKVGRKLRKYKLMQGKTWYPRHD